MGCQQSDLRVSPLGQQQQEEEKKNLLNDNHPQPQRPSIVEHARLPQLPLVPTDSWYSQPFTETTRMTLTEFHIKQRGQVVFASAYIPVGASELNELPGRSPLVRTSLEIGKDLIYGMGYFHNTPLFIEHQWRSRVAHYERYSLSQARRQSQQLQKQQQQQQQQEEVNSKNKEIIMNSLENGGRGDIAKTIYHRPYFDTFIGIKIYVDDELIPDHYPTSKSLPNCTATIDSSEAFSNWICIPIVLIGYLNNFTLSTITLYRFMSLTFVEHMLRQPIISRNNGGLSSIETDKITNSSEGTENGEPVKRIFNIRLEVVYGCRSEMNFCTDYISKGNVQIIMTQESKTALKSYEEKLRKLIQNSTNISREQVVPMDRLALSMQQNSPTRRCLFCKSLLQFTCTICGAQLCGTAMCVWQPFAGYPHGCAAHKAQV